jgi:hypothetical protein
METYNAVGHYQVGLPQLASCSVTVGVGTKNAKRDYNCAVESRDLSANQFLFRTRFDYCTSSTSSTFDLSTCCPSALPICLPLPPSKQRSP